MWHEHQRNVCPKTMHKRGRMFLVFHGKWTSKNNIQNMTHWRSHFRLTTRDSMNLPLDRMPWKCWTGISLRNINEAITQIRFDLWSHSVGNKCYRRFACDSVSDRLNDDNDDKTSTRDINAQNPQANDQANQSGCLLVQALAIGKYFWVAIHFIVDLSIQNCH